MTVACTGDPSRTLNVLLIGESGVGKSTWINAFGNYCSFGSLEEAAKAGGLFPIPSTVTDPQTRKQITICTEGKLQSPKQITTAVTRKPKEYVFRHVNTNTVINLIDTPGLLDADTSTHDTYKEHVDNILNVLLAYQEIHAIFILIKANVTRLTDVFQYTLTAIFKRLDKSACNNVIFIFTHAASANFKIDKTQSVLMQFLKENSLPIALPPEKPTSYCFENDTVKYLAVCKNNISHDEDDEEDAQRSWRRSVASTNELLYYLCSLKPHSLTVMMSINDATHMVSVVSKLALDIMMRIFRDMNELNEKNGKKKLKEDLHISQATTPADRCTIQYQFIDLTVQLLIRLLTAMMH